jgi:chromosome partitioning protein
MSTSEQKVRKGVTITLANQKGGVTKTTSAANIAMMLTFAGNRVLAVDCDPQGHLSYTFGYTPDLLEATLYDVLKESLPITKVIRQTFFDPTSTTFLDQASQEAGALKAGAIAGPDLLPINIVASSADGELQSNPTWGTLLRRKLRPIRHLYDYIVMDTNPSLGKLTINALCASDYVCIPLTPEVLPTQGLVSLAKSIEEARTSEANPDLSVAGIIFTRVKHNYKTHTGIMDFVRQTLAPQLHIPCFETEIKESAAFLNAASVRSVVVVAEPESDHAIAYWQFLTELVQRVQGPGLDVIRQTHQKLLHGKQERERARQERAEARKGQG